MHKGDLLTDAMASKLRSHWRGPLTSIEIGQRLGISNVTVWSFAKRLGLPARPRAFHPRMATAIAPSGVERERIKLQRATLLHLLDLKRAGHSPSRTELILPGEHMVVLRRSIPQQSWSGSPAAMCAEG